MTIDDNDKLNNIIDALNELEAEKEDLELCGATTVDMALDFMQDEEDYQEPTAEELEKIRITCDYNADQLNRIEEKQNDLRLEYFLLTDVYPFRNDATMRYQRDIYREMIKRRNNEE